MKTLLSLFLLSSILVWCTQINGNKTENVLKDDILSSQILQNTQTGSLSDAEKSSLLQMREEEKLALDVYSKLYDVWKVTAFNNISQSESTHTNAVKSLLDRYDIADPAKTEAGKFSSPELQKLYDTLVAKWSQSLLDALIVGATIEDLDIYDIQTQSKSIDNEDILLVYQNLERGSRNHLRSFMRQITKNWGSYTPQYISQENFDSILNSPQERGGNGRNH